MIYVVFIFFLCYFAGIQSECLHASGGRLPPGFKIGNLDVVTSTDSHEIIDDASCEKEINSKLLVRSPNTFLLQYNNINISNLNKKYLLTMVDLTAEKLVWMVSNMTVNKKEIKFNDSKITLPLSNINPYSKWITKDYFYEEPDLGNNKSIEFLIFEESQQNVSSSYIDSNAIHSTPFNLTAWMDSQQNSGITIRGPVAGRSVMLVRHEQKDRSATAPIVRFRRGLGFKSLKTAGKSLGHYNDSNDPIFLFIFFIAICCGFVAICCEFVACCAECNSKIKNKEDAPNGNVADV